MNKLEEIISLLEDLSRNCNNQRHINSLNDVIDILQNIQYEEIVDPITTNQNDSLFEFENFGEGVALIAYYGWDQKSIVVPDIYDGKKLLGLQRMYLRNVQCKRLGLENMFL